jgi:glycosyltransferase involved in cell wall biosynthesis
VTTEPLNLTVVVPTRNAGLLLERCLESIRHNGPAELIVVDGNSTDDTIDIAQRFGASILNDGGRGLPVARALGAAEATHDRVVLIDADVVLPDGSLKALAEEFETGEFAALQAGLHSVAEGGYWGQALAHHHRTGRSKNWFGLVATIFERQTLIDEGFDERFVSGEDIEMRWRLKAAGHKLGVSERVIVTHRFADDSFAFALGQFRADGEGLGRMVRKHGIGGLKLLGLPLAGAVRGIALSVVRGQPRWIPYFVTFCVCNYTAMLRGLVERVPPHTQTAELSA